VPTPTFDGLRVLAFESRRAIELTTLIATFGGQAIAAPALREVPLDSSQPAREFVGSLDRGEFDVVIFLTGVGIRALLEAIEPEYSRERFAASLMRVKTAVRGPKPLAVLRELNVPAWVTAPEPNTWRELVAAIDARAHEQSLAGARIGVQEYGVSNPEFLAALEARGAHVTAVPIYRWELPEDLSPLRDAIAALTRGDVDVVMFTSGIQMTHLWQVAETLGAHEDVRRALQQAVVASIGPTTSEELTRRGINPDLQASRPKIGMLVREAAAQSRAILQSKRG
jgi:uroporphyrinogen-III synthase